MRVDVTAEDIRTGIRNSYYRHPIALAASRTLGTDAYVTAGRDRISLDYSTFSLRIRLPPAAKEFIRQFDDGVRVQPFNFELQVEDACELM